MLKKSSTTPPRGFADDGDNIPEASRCTAAQKLTHLELMLGQIANYCPIISRNTIVKKINSSKSNLASHLLKFWIPVQWSHFLDFNNIHLKPGERPEDL